MAIVRHHLTPLPLQMQYGKQYRSSKDDAYRQSVFEQNQEFINNHNEQYENGLVSFSLAMNQFGDMVG